MAELLGSTLGPYQILEQIGLGGMATVYKAYQPGMNRLVALKVLPEHYARDPRFVKRFEREAQVVAKLEHRNIIPIYDYGSHDDITYLAMRYLQAGTVKDILAHGALPLADVAKLLSDISSALDYAHSQGIIHRDVKPSNVLVDKQGNAYLTDFGIAKVLEGAADFTGSSVLGTPTYMAPEQTLGKPATAQSDIYSLGVMLYEMVVGKPPFEADTPMAIALMHVHEPLPLPRKIKDDIPEAVELIILKALAKDPKDRFQTANDLARVFASAIGAESVSTSSRLIELASGAAEGKGSEEVTYDIREEVKRKERTEKRKKLMRLVPVGMVIVLFIGLASALIWFSLQMQESQTASQRTATAVVFFAQTATESVNRLMATPSFNTAVAQIQEATRTQAAIETVMQSYRLTYAKGTQSVEETIIALTPTKTPTSTPTRTPTRTPIPPTFTPSSTSTPIVGAPVDDFQVSLVGSASALENGGKGSFRGEVSGEVAQASGSNALDVFRGLGVSFLGKDRGGNSLVSLYQLTYKIPVQMQRVDFEYWGSVDTTFTIYGPDGSQTGTFYDARHTGTSSGNNEIFRQSVVLSPTIGTTFKIEVKNYVCCSFYLGPVRVQAVRAP